MFQPACSTCSFVTDIVPMYPFAKNVHTRTMCTHTRCVHTQDVYTHKMCTHKQNVYTHIKCVHAHKMYTHTPYESEIDKAERKKNPEIDCAHYYSYDLQGEQVPRNDNKGALIINQELHAKSLHLYWNQKSTTCLWTMLEHALKH